LSKRRCDGWLEWASQCRTVIAYAVVQNFGCKGTGDLRNLAFAVFLLWGLYSTRLTWQFVTFTTDVRRAFSPSQHAGFELLAVVYNIPKKHISGLRSYPITS
jgi:hypothetical protein